MFLLDFLYNNKFLVSYLIMALYLLNIFAGLVHQDYRHVWYWASALSITACVTWGYAK